MSSEALDKQGGSPKAPLADYTADKIQALKGLEAVRVRPGMYIGGTGIDGLHHLVWEILDNSIDEHMAGHGDEISVVIHGDGSLSVQDFGRGIPTDIHPTEGIPGVQLALTTLHAGGKFEKSAYGKAGGLHGVGAACVNALSEMMEVVVEQKGKRFRIEFSRGEVSQPLSVEGTSKRTGTYVRFRPDPQIFKETRTFDYTRIASRLRYAAFLNAGLKITLLDERDEGAQVETFHAEKGVADFVGYLNRARKPLHDVVHFSGESEDVDIEVAFQYCDGFYKDDIHSFANNIRTGEGGTHLTGVKSALTRVVKEYISENGKGKQKEVNLEGSDLLEGLALVVAVRVRDAQFEGQTKGKLNNSEVRGIVESFTTDQLRTYLAENPRTVKEILEKVLQAARAREASRKARDLNRKKSALEAGVLPGKLADCSYNNPEMNEVYLVEGDSAGGSAKQGRSREFQAILPLKGKILNVEKADYNKILANEEIRNIITALGTGIGTEFDLANLRYHKVVIMTDADVDGSHIKTLILTLFFRHFKEMVERGHVYLAMPPLYSVQKGNGKKRFALTDEQRDALVQEMGGSGAKLNVQRYKGLGEMNPEELFETTMNPKTRTLQQVTIEDALLADELFSQLMGDDVESRRVFIEKNATYADLDV